MKLPLLVAISSAAVLYMQAYPPMFLIETGIKMFESGSLPDAFARMGIRAMLRQRIVDHTQPDNSAQQDANMAVSAKFLTYYGLCVCVCVCVCVFFIICFMYFVSSAEQRRTKT